MATRVTLLALVEASLLLLSFLLAVQLYWHGDPATGLNTIEALGPRAVAFTAILMIAFVSVGLYRSGGRAAYSDTLVRILAAAVLASIVHAVLYYIFPKLFTGRGTLMLALCGAVLAVAVTRRFSHWLFGADVFKRNVLILGTGNAAALLARACGDLYARSFRLAGFVAGAGDASGNECSPRLDRADGLLALALKHKIHEIVVAVDDRRQYFPIRELLNCRLAGVNVTEALTFIERETGKINLDVLRPGWLIYGEGFRRRSLDSVLKRLADLSGSILLIMLTAPLFALAVLAILIESRGRGGILYRQRRVGLHGRYFDLLKLRTMIPNAEADGKARWAVAKDGRVTRVGALLRRFRIDELPQAINILKGEMSFVGPRPERPEFVTELSRVIPYYEERHWVKPGLTGWAQLCFPYGASIDDARQKLQYDLYYVKHQSVSFDLMIMLQTLDVVIWGCKRTAAPIAEQVVPEERHAV